MKRKLLSKGLSVLVVLAMLFSSFLFQGNVVYANEIGPDSVARIGDTYYDSLQDAVDAASPDADNTVIQMVGNVESEAPLEVHGKTVTLDLNGHTFTKVVGSRYTEAISVSNSTEEDDAQLILKDSAGGGKITGKDGIRVYPDENKVTVESGTIEAENYALTSRSGASFDVKGGTVKGGLAAAQIEEDEYATGPVFLTISGGTLDGGILSEGEDAVINISGGTINRPDGSAVKIEYNGRLTISNGEINGDYAIDAGEDSSATLEGGVFTGTTAAIKTAGNGKVNINGGYYSDNLANENDHCILPEGKKLLPSFEKTGYYEVAANVVRINGIEYSSLAAAHAEAHVGGTIVVLADYTEKAATITLDKNITIDLNGHTITKPGRIDIAGNVDIIDSSSEGTGEGTGKIDFVTGGAEAPGFQVIDRALNLHQGTVTSAAPPVIRMNYGMVTVDQDASVVCTDVGSGNEAISGNGTVHVRGSVEAKGSAIGISSSGRNTIAAVYDGATVTSETGIALAANTTDSRIYMQGGTVQGPTAVKTNGQNSSIEGGTVIGTDYGINATGGGVTVSGGVIKATDGVSVARSGGAAFNIEGGVFSDSAGNAEGFTRADNKLLVKGADSGHPDMFTLGDAVAGIERGGTTLYYSTLGAAYNDVAENETIKLLEDIDNGENSFNSEKTYTLDLNGKTLESSGETVVSIGAGTLTIDDSSEAGTGTIHATRTTGWPKAVKLGENRNSSGLILKNGTLKSDIGEGLYNFQYGTTTVEGGQILSTNYHAIENAGNLTVRGENTFVSGRVNAIVNMTGFSADGILNIEGGKIKRTYNSGSAAAILISAGTATISGGDIEGDSGTGVAITGGTVTFSEGSTATVKGTGNPSLSKEGGTINIFGGKFSDDVGNGDGYNRPESKYLMDEDDDGWYELTQCVATITRDDVTTRYTTLSKAFFDAAANDTVKVIADITLSDAVELQDRAITLDGGDYQITNGAGSVLEIGTGGELTLIGGILSGSRYGIEASEGTVTVEDGTVKGTAASIHASAPATFKINGGAFSDDTGNSDSYIRPGNQYLKLDETDGLYRLADVDKTALQAAVDDAIDPNDITESDDATAIREGELWATAEDKQAYVDALSAAEEVLRDTAAIQSDVDDALAALQEAAEKIKTAKVDKTALNNAIKAAKEDRDNTAVSDGGNNLADGTVYVDQAAQSALTDAIAVAQALADATNASQSDVDAGKAELDTAKAAFDKAKKTAKVDKTALNNAIKAAKDAEKGVKTSADGKDVEPSDQWTTAEEKQALDDAIAAAEALAKDKNATQSDVDTAATAVEKAAGDYNEAKKAGKKTQPAPAPAPAPGDDPERTAYDGTKVGPGASAACADEAITTSDSEEGPAGSSFAPLMLRSTKQTKKSIKLSWKKVKGAKTYVLYGNACGKKNKMKRIKILKKNSINVKKAAKKVKKGTYYKFMVVALDADNLVVSTSKVVHVSTKGSAKKANPKAVVVKAKVNKAGKKLKKYTKTSAIKLKKGKKTKLKATYTKPAKSKVRKHRGVRFESANPGIATVSEKGVVKAKKKGKTKIYVYAQNGARKVIKVTVK